MNEFAQKFYAMQAASGGEPSGCRASTCLRVYGAAGAVRTASLAIFVLAACLGTSACSKQIVWEEEVPLNSRDTVWVRRSTEYTLQSHAGNPLDIRMSHVREQSIEFNWRGSAFKYKGDAHLMLLAIDPAGRPVLLARADDNSWGWEHDYNCTVPYYVQLVPKGDGKTWTWPSSPASWLYRMNANLMVALPPLKGAKQRYTAAEVAAVNNSLGPETESRTRVEPGYSSQHCPGSRSR